MTDKLQFTFEDDFNSYLNPARFYSYQDINNFILIGGRGIGKTTGFVKHSIKDFLKNGNEFVYCRRYKTEIMKAKDLLQPICTGTSTKGIGNGIFAYTYNKVRIGYGVALSLQQSYKSGVDFSKVNTLIYDEALIQAGGSLRYLPNEITFLFELISTIFRTRKNYRVFILSNNADIFNPYFAYFNVPRFKDRYIDKDRSLYCELLPNKPALLKKEEETPLYKLTKGTPYGEYHYNNEVLSPVLGTIAEKPSNSILVARIVYDNFTLNIYRYGMIKIYVEFRDKAILDNLTFTIQKNNQPNYVDVMRYRRSDVKVLIDNSYYNGEVAYNDQKGITIMHQFMEEI